MSDLQWTREQIATSWLRYLRKRREEGPALDFLGRKEFVGELPVFGAVIERDGRKYYVSCLELVTQTAYVKLWPPSWARST